MALTKSMVSKFPWDERYGVLDVDNVLIPALLVYPEAIASNIARTGANSFYATQGERIWARRGKCANPAND